jgi:competence protein ComEC
MRKILRNDQFRKSLKKENERIFLWFPVGMGIGIIFYFSLTKEPVFWGSLVVLLVQILVLFLVRRLYYLRLLSLGFLSITIGFVSIHYKTWHLQTIEKVVPLQKQLKGEFTGEILEIEFLQTRQRYIIQLEDGRKVRLSAKQNAPSWSIGDKLQFRATLFPFSKPLLGDGYDHGRAAFYKGLSASGWMVDGVVVSKKTSVDKGGQLLRSRLTQALFKAIPGESGAVAAALVTGERGRISDATRQSYADAGIAHVLAISGLHLSMIAGLVFMIFRRGLCLSVTLAERYNLKKISSLLTFPFLTGYLFISGLGVPAIRSFIMVGIVLLGGLVDRRSLSMRTLSLAAIVILLLQPENLLSASFALSFTAVMALIALYEGGWSPLKEWEKKGKKWRQSVVYCTGIIASTVVATLGTLPITLYIFNRISLQAILGNLVAIPLMGFMIMPLLLVGVLTLPFGPFPPLFWVLDRVLGIMTGVAHWTATLPGAGIQIPTPPEAFIWLTTLGGIWVCFWRTRIRLLGLIPCGVALALLLVKPSPFVWLSSEAQLYWYDGQKLSTFSHARPNKFAEQMLLRHLGLKAIETVSAHSVHCPLAGVPVLLLNESFRKKDHGTLCKTVQVIASSRSVPLTYAEEADILLDRSDLEMGQGGVVRFNKNGGDLHTVTRCRPWHRNPYFRLS